MKRSTCVSLIALAISMSVRHGQASQDTVGTNGIFSNATGLTGSGARIGQVEPERPGKPMIAGGFDDPAHSATDTRPTYVALRNAEVMAAQANTRLCPKSR